MKLKQAKSYSSLAVIIVLLILIFLAVIFSGSNSPVPKNIKNKINFVIFIPGTGSDYQLNKSSFKYDSNDKILTFNTRSANTLLVFAEQQSPPQFNEIPQYWDKLSEKLRAYSSFDSFYGQVALTHPQEFKGQQAAIFNGKGTFVTIHATTGSLSDDQWRQLFNNFQVIK